LLIQPDKVVVEIAVPRNGSLVEGASLSVSGIVRPSAARVTFVVRSERDTRWWTQEAARRTRVEQETGYWNGTVLLGTATEGRSDVFEIVALASSNSLFFDLLTGRYTSEGDRHETVPLWSQSTPVLVRRTK
jgi:hypothetical protein